VSQQATSDTAASSSAAAPPIANRAAASVSAWEKYQSHDVRRRRGRAH
jgi:hypothetical protein